MHAVVVLKHSAPATWRREQHLARFRSLKRIKGTYVQYISGMAVIWLSKQNMLNATDRRHIVKYKHKVILIHFRRFQWMIPAVD